MKVIAEVAEKITVMLAGKGIIPEEDAALYRYGIENGIIITSNLLVSLFFYGSLRSFSGGIHCKSRAGCFAASILILFIPAYLCDWVVILPLVTVIIGGLTAMVVILALSPVESVNKPLNDEDFAYYGRMSRCIAGWQACTLVTLYCLDWLDYFYSGYSSLVLVAVFLIMGKISTKYYT